MSSPSLSSMAASATAAFEQALRELVGLAEALGTPGTVPKVLAKAKAVLAEAEVALAGLEAAVAAAVAAAAAVPPIPELDAEGLYRSLGMIAEDHASELERELKRNRERHRALWVVRTFALVLLLLFTPLLSLDVVRQALGVTQESHLVSSLATVTIVCQVALWGAGTSERHLVTALGHQRQQALRYRHRARVAAAATAATTKDIPAVNVTLGMLEQVTAHLRNLVDAVTQDLEMAQGFPASAWALGDAVEALGTTMGDKEETRRLARTLEALREDE